MKKEELKPCPFCGSDVDIFYAGTGTYEIFSKNNDGSVKRSPNEKEKNKLSE